MTVYSQKLTGTCSRRQQKRSFRGSSWDLDAKGRAYKAYEAQWKRYPHAYRVEQLRRGNKTHTGLWQQGLGDPSWRYEAYYGPTRYSHADYRTGWDYTLDKRGRLHGAV